MISDLSHLPEHKQHMLAELVHHLSHIDGMTAIVLGGSYANGTQHEGSDLDVGLYYYEAHPYAIEDIRRVARMFSADGEPTVTGFYQWGAWVNGGAWIHTSHGKVDFLYRNIDHIQRTFDEAQAGISHHDYAQQPTHGFYSVIYLAETHICLPLFDPQGVITHLKEQVAVYPPKLKARITRDSLWSGEFTLIFARNFAAQGDIYNTVGCLTRVAGNLTQALFAMNDRYFIRDKKVMQDIARFEVLPAGYIESIERILAHPGSSAEELAQTVNDLEQVWKSVVALTGDLYQPAFQL